MTLRPYARIKAWQIVSDTILSPGKQRTLTFQSQSDYNVVVNGKEYKDLIWWYKTPTVECSPIAGHLCFYNERVDIYIDGVKEVE